MFSPLLCIAYISLSDISLKYNYVRPTFNDNRTINIVDGRHPVLENLLGPKYIVNDVNINSLFIFEKENLLIVDEYFGFEKTIKCNEKGWTVIKIDKLEENIDLIKRYTNG